MNQAEQTMAAACAAGGLDLCGAARVGAYNARLQDQPGFQLPELGSAENTVVLVGNTRALWPRFLEALRDSEPLRAAEHPLDSYCRTRVQQTAQATAERLGVECVVRHSPDAPPAAFAAQHLAEVCGLAQRAPCALSVHAEHGPWIGLRAAVVFALPYAGPDPHRAAPCDSCRARPCLPAFERAMSADAATHFTSAKQRVAAHYDRWLAVRDACPVGRGSRYSAQQLDYHYLKNRSALLSELVPLTKLFVDV